MTVRTRFAPSPTGYLHVGGARTALYSWLYAHSHQGTFILRIEDTDVERSTQEAVTAIIESMEWLGLHYQEGPFYQTKRMDRYKDVLDQLIAQGSAYRCFCSKERIEKLREEQLAHKQKPRYDGFCRHKTEQPNDRPFVIRFKNPETGFVTFDDQVKGTISFNNNELDDLIIARTDGMPTYNFTVVVDDWDMNITHVIRGDDHINNTPRQINILTALGAKLPLYAHIPMILGADGKRLSKRHGAVSVLQYRDEGFLPHALLNYLVRLGWSSKDKEIFSIEEMMAHFTLKSISRSPAIFNPEKLLWLNQHYIKTSPPAEIAPHLEWHLKKMNIDLTQGPSLEDIIIILRERSKTLVEMAEGSRFLFVNLLEQDQTVLEKEQQKNDLRPLYQHLLNKLGSLATWDKDSLHEAVNSTAADLDLKMGKVAQPLRIAVTGTTTSPSIDLTLQLLGKDKTLDRLQKALAMLN